MGADEQSRPSILIAEDEVRIASFVARGLERAGYTTAVTADGRTALARTAAGDVALLVLDLGLPGMDGIAVLRELRRRGNRTPVVVITALTAPDLAAEVAGAGAEVLLHKPFELEALRTAVQRLAPVAGRARSGPAARAPGLARRLAALIAFDSWTSARTAGVRGGGPDEVRTLVAESAAADVALELHALAGGRHRLDGQVFPHGHRRATGAVVHLEAGGGRTLRAAVDDLGQFAVSALPAGAWQLSVLLDDVDVVLEPIHLGAAGGP